MQLPQDQFLEDIDLVFCSRQTNAAFSYTDEEVERCYEEFYEDVHTEFLKFGEIVNFKVCRNGSFHLRGNVYIHYKSLDSAVQAYHSVNGRYFAGKQVTCEFVSLTKWKIAICGEYMKSRLKTCSRGTACNFLHCFGNPGGDYEWANSDKPPPRYWVKNMSALFGYSDESWYNKQIEQQSPRERRNCSRILTSEEDRYYSKRYRSMGTDQLNGNYHRSEYKEDDVRHSRFQERHISDGRKRQKSLDEKYYEEETNYKSHHCGNDRTDDADSDRDWSDRERDGDRQHRHHGGVSKSSRQDMESRDYDRASRRTTHGSGSDEDSVKRERETDRDRQQRRTRKRSRHRKKVSELSDDDQGESNDAKLEQQRVQIHGHSSKFHQRIKSHETDSRYNYDDVGHRDSENEPLPKKQKRSSRKFPVDENVVSYGSHQHEGRSKSRDNGYFPDDGNGERNRWEPDKNIPEKHHHRSRRKLSGDDSEQQSVRYKSDDHNSDELSAVSRVRVRRSSSREKHLDSLGELDSTEELKQFEDSNKKNQDKQNSHNRKYKRRAKKTRI